MVRESAGPSGTRVVSAFPFVADELTLDALNDLVHTLHPAVHVAAFDVRETFHFGSGQVSTAGRIALRLSYTGAGAEV